MATTSTPNYQLVKPTPGTNEDVDVQAHLNDNWDILDTNLKLVSDATTLTRPIAQLRNTTVTNIANNTANLVVVFQSEDFDTHNGHDPVTNPSRWTCPASQGGTYRVSGRVGWTAKASTGTTDIRAASLYKNGAQINATSDQIRALDQATTQPVNLIVPTLIALVPGDYLELNAFQNSGAALDTFVGGGLSSMITIEWVRP
jgi:hypothetical protein